MFVVRADSPYRAIADLRGKPVAFGARGSGLVILARYVLDGLGLEQERDFQAVFLDARRRRARRWCWTAAWPRCGAAASAGPASPRWPRARPARASSCPTPTASTASRPSTPFLKTLTVPAGSYPGQTAAIVSVGSWSFIMARPSLADDVAYRLARALHRGEAALASRLAQGRETTAANTVAAVARPDLLHPGARRYLAEIGLTR